MDASPTGLPCAHQTLDGFKHHLSSALHLLSGPLGDWLAWTFVPYFKDLVQSYIPETFFSSSFKVYLNIFFNK
jgi:hypothetical protein